MEADRSTGGGSTPPPGEAWNALSFLLSFDETLITLFLAGSEATLPIRLWGMMRVGFVPTQIFYEKHFSGES